MALEVGLGALLTTLGTATAVAGTAYSAYEGNKAAGQSRRAEQLRQQQMNLDSAKRQRDFIRKMQMAQAQSSTRLSQSGAQFSSAAAVSSGNIASETQTDINYNQFSTDIGNNIFDANAKQTEYKSNAEAGQGFSKLGMSLLQSTPTITRIGTEIAGRSNNSGGAAASQNNPGPYISSIYGE